MVTLFVDSDCDLTPADCREYGAKLISMPYSIGEKTVYPYEDFAVFDDRAYYEDLRNGVMPTTAALAKEKYIAYFEPEFRAGNDILYAHFSKAMTNSFDFMDQAYRELQEKYPERKLYAIDTKGITIEGMNVALAVCDLYKAGKTPEEIIEWAKTEVDKFAIFFFADDLKFFHRSGRVSGLSATMGTLVGIRPLISIKENGKMEACGKAKGRRHALQYLVDQMVEIGEDVAAHRIIIGHTDAPEIAAELKGMIEEKFGAGLDIRIVPANPTAGAHCGPNGVGVSFHASHR